jgi:DNA polymerase
MDERIKSRLRLWLRSERALGLPSVGPIAMRALARPVGGLSLVEDEALETMRRAEDVEEAEEVETPQPKLPVKSPAQAPRPARDLLDVGAVAPPASERLIPPPSREAFSAPVLSREQKVAALTAMEQNEVRGCTKCRLCEQRTHTVFGEGDADAQLMFIGEGPGETEDRTGRPFVGRAGELLNKMIAGMGLNREQVMIANIVKCRPPGNRVPAPDEVATCTPYLERQIEIVRPKVIVTLGLPATQYMLQVTTSMGRLRGNWHTWRGIRLMPTYHPAYILRNETRQTKALVWSDLKQVMAELGLPLPKGRGET